MKLKDLLSEAVRIAREDMASRASEEPSAEEAAALDEVGKRTIMLAGNQPHCFHQKGVLPLSRRAAVVVSAFTPGSRGGVR